MQLSKLADPFSESEIEWRIGQAGAPGDSGLWANVLVYVTNRAIMDRLDAVAGPENWRNEYKEWRGKGVICGLSIRIDGEWVTKWDGADETDIESTKGGLSDSMKRAAVQWAIGRYLYRLPASFLPDRNLSRNRQPGWKTGYIKKANLKFWWTPPKLPGWAIPKGETPTEPTPPKPEPAKEKAAPPAAPSPAAVAANQDAPPAHDGAAEIEAMKQKLHDAGLQKGVRAMEATFRTFPKQKRDLLVKYQFAWLQELRTESELGEQERAAKAAQDQGAE